MSKTKIAVSLTFIFSVSLFGCGKQGIDFATKAQTLAECSLSGQSGCNTKLSDIVEMSVAKASLLTAMDSIRVSARLTGKADCLAVGNTAGKNTNSELKINDAIIMQYGKPGPSFSYLEQICNDSDSFLVSLTVAKST